MLLSTFPKTWGKKNVPSEHTRTGNSSKPRDDEARMNATRDRQSELVSEMNATKTKLIPTRPSSTLRKFKRSKWIWNQQTFLPLCPLSFPIFPFFLPIFSFFISFLPSFLPFFFTNCCVCRRSNNTTAGTKFCGQRISKHCQKTKWQTQRTTKAGGREVDERQPSEEEEEETPFQISANHQP